jgi:hypothetical protein
MQFQEVKMATKKAPAKKKEAGVDIRKLNEGVQMRSYSVGQRVKVYHVPYQEKRLQLEGKISKIIYDGDLMCYADVIPDGKENPVGSWLYKGKVMKPTYGRY